MNPVLIDAIQRRLGEQSTDQLLALWTTNDRVMWSPEAFEAVKVELAGRGVRELPPQNDPAPLARAHSPSMDPATQYWIGWVRPVLWIGVAISCLKLAHQAVAAWEMRTEWRAFWFDEPWHVFIGTMQYIVLPSAFIAGAIACLKIRHWSRTLLLAYTWTAIPIELLDLITQIRSARWASDSDRIGLVVTSAYQLVLPVVLLILLRRPEIRLLFVPAATGRAFEPLPAANVAQSSTGA